MTTDVRTVSPLAGQKVRVVVKLVPGFHPAPGAPPAVAGTSGPSPRRPSPPCPSPRLPPRRSSRARGAGDRARTLRSSGWRWGPAASRSPRSAWASAWRRTRTAGQREDREHVQPERLRRRPSRPDAAVRRLRGRRRLIAAGVTTYVLGTRETGETGAAARGGDADPRRRLCSRDLHFLRNLPMRTIVSTLLVLRRCWRSAPARTTATRWPAGWSAAPARGSARTASPATRARWGRGARTPAGPTACCPARPPSARRR